MFGRKALFVKNGLCGASDLIVVVAQYALQPTPLCKNSAIREMLNLTPTAHEHCSLHNVTARSVLLSNLIFFIFIIFIF